MTAAPAPARLRGPVLPVTPGDGSDRAAGPGAAPPVAAAAPRSHAEARTRLQRGLDLLPLLVPGCGHASATTTAYAGSRSGSVTGATAARADALQDELDEGPSLHALRTGHSVLSHDLGTETRWPRWCDHAARDLGLGGALSVLLTGAGRSVGTLTLYADRPGGLSDVDIATLHTLAAPLARALAVVRSTT